MGSYFACTEPRPAQTFWAFHACNADYFLCKYFSNGNYGIHFWGSVPTPDSGAQVKKNMAICVCPMLPGEPVVTKQEIIVCLGISIVISLSMNTYGLLDVRWDEHVQTQV